MGAELGANKSDGSKSGDMKSKSEERSKTEMEERT